MSDNKFNRPISPPPPLFLGEPERNLVKQVNDELIERVIGQQILYFAIDAQRTNFHPIYGEAIVKNFLPPIRIYALVTWEGTIEVTNMNFVDKESKIVVKFHKRRLNEDQDIIVKPGDFIQYGNYYYEIIKLEEPKLLFGQSAHTFEVDATCIRSRKGNFDAK
jgi:hypothetical protein